MVRIVKDIYSKKVNNQIIELLKITPGWYFGYDNKSYKLVKDDSFDNFPNLIKNPYKPPQTVKKTSRESAVRCSSIDFYI